MVPVPAGTARGLDRGLCYPWEKNQGFKKAADPHTIKATAKREPFSSTASYMCFPLQPGGRGSLLLKLEKGLEVQALGLLFLSSRSSTEQRLEIFFTWQSGSGQRTPASQLPLPARGGENSSQLCKEKMFIKTNQKEQQSWKQELPTAHVRCTGIKQHYKSAQAGGAAWSWRILPFPPLACLCTATCFCSLRLEPASIFHGSDNHSFLATQPLLLPVQWSLPPSGGNTVPVHLGSWCICTAPAIAHATAYSTVHVKI